MIRIMKIVFLVWLAVFIQSSVINLISPLGLMPNFIVIIIALAGLKQGISSGVWTGLLAGFLADCYHPSAMGIFSAGGAVTGYLSGAARDRIYREHLISQSVLAAVLSLIYQTFAYFGHDGGTLIDFPRHLIRYGLGGALYTAVVTALLLPAMERWAYGKRYAS